MTKQSADKTNHLVVRIDDETKKAFMEKARTEGRTASLLVINFIESYLNDDYVDVDGNDIARLESELNKLKSEFQEMKVVMLGKSAA